MRTADILVIGQRYSRRTLKEMFGIRDATLNTGVFRPKFDNSIWLFITEKKGKGQTEYNDLLNGDHLEWDGQMSGKSDKLIRTHRSNSMDLLVFYRKEKRQFEDSSFIYEGPFEYVSDKGSAPTHFTFKRVAASERLLADHLDSLRLQETMEGLEDVEIRLFGNRQEQDKK